MKKFLFLLALIPLSSFGQEISTRGQEIAIKNGVTIVSPIGYNYDLKLSTKDKAHYISDKKEEILVYVFKVKEKLTEEMIDEALLSQNTQTSGIEWELWENGPNFKPHFPFGGKWSAVSIGISGIYGYRIAFELDENKLILIQSFALSYKEALKTVVQTSSETQLRYNK